MWMEGFRGALLAAFVGARSVACFAAPATDDNLVGRGEYLARLGDCGACHTAKGGKFMAGGLAIKTPMGAIYSTNITPDAKTGIGGYTLAQFDRALRRGVAADGRHLYPAMPYPSFARVTDEDVKALYAFFTRGVTAVEQVNTPSAMRFPFNIRASMAVWNFLFLNNEPFVADPSRDAAWNRGAYLVEGLAHCGTCHTPRGFLMQEKAFSDDGKDYLAGATLATWRSVGLRKLTSEPDLVRMLKTGANDHAMAFGPMTEVIARSTPHFSDDDLQAVAHFLTSLAPRGATPPRAEAVDEKTLHGTRRGLGYAQFCASCHRRDGLGAPEIFPALAQNPSMLSADPTSALHIVLAGGASAETHHRAHVFAMPAFAALNDDEIADILNFARNAWGNHADGVTPAQVKALRQDLRLPPPAPRSVMRPRFADLLSEADSDRLILGARLMTETRAMLPGNVGNALNCSSCHLNGGTVAKALPFFGLTSQFPRENARAGRVITIEDRINGCFQRSEAGVALPVESPEMRAMVAFMAWLKGDIKPDGKIEGRGTEKIDASVKPDAARGAQLYNGACSACHGENGAGMKNAAGDWILPPLWGDASFNIGAGMARARTAAGFINANMPVAHVPNFPQNQGGLSDQDALDIAEFLTHQPRPDFAGKENDWPKGGKPADAPY